MTDALAPWANLGMLVVIGGITTLVLVLLAGTTGGDPAASTARRAVPQVLGAVGVIAVFLAGVVVAAFAVAAPERWWFALYGWGVWIVGEIVVLALLGLVYAVQRRIPRT